MENRLPALSLIVAMDENRLIGRDGDLPWRLSNDLKHFKSVTMGHPILMGRKTWESLGKPLPGRRHLVLTRDQGYVAEGVEVVHDLDQALSLCWETNQVFVIGGAEIYKLVLPRVDQMIITHVDAVLEGDTWFPEVDWEQWQVEKRERHAADERNEYDHEFVVYKRKH